MFASPDPIRMTAGIMDAWFSAAHSILEMQSQAASQTMKFWSPMMGAQSTPAWPSAAATDPFSFWKAAQTSANAWPMAFGMMSYGVPSSYAWPAASMTSSMMTTWTDAARAVEAPFSTYHSGNGFAAAQIWPTTLPPAFNPFAAFMPAPKPAPFNPWAMFWGR